MKTKPEQWVELMRQAKLLDDEAYALRRRATVLKAEMGHPFDGEIEQAANAKREIVRGCAQGPVK